MGDKLSALRTVFYDIRPERSFVLLLDTNTQISRLAGTVAISASACAGFQQLVQPFTFLPQDVGTIELAGQYQSVCRGEARESHEKLLLWLPKMGRPLLDDTFLKGDLRFGLLVVSTCLKHSINSRANHEMTWVRIILTIIPWLL